MGRSASEFSSVNAIVLTAIPSARVLTADERERRRPAESPNRVTKVSQQVVTKIRLKPWDYSVL